MTKDGQNKAILVVDPSGEWQEKIVRYLAKAEISYEVSGDGKDAQLKMYRNKFKFVLVDIMVKHTSAFELVRYIKMNSPGSKIIISISNRDQLAELEIDEDDLKKMGVAHILVKPFNSDQLTMLLEREIPVAYESTSENKEENKEIFAPDEEFTHVDAHSFVAGGIAVFDLFVRLKIRHYAKIVHKGDVFDSSRLRKYLDKGVTYFYFRTKDRFLYINQMNNIIEKLSKLSSSSKISSELKESIVRVSSEKYVEELFTRGLKPEVIDEGHRLCKSVSDLIVREKNLREMMMLFERYSESIYGHSYLVMFYSLVIGRSINWHNVGTIENLGMGAMLHDIGKIKINSKITQKSQSSLTTDEFKIYQTHPTIGQEMVAAQSNIPTAVLQIIAQHHETVDGLGFPERISGGKIFPMAKVVGLADRFVNVMSKEKSNPLESLKKFLKNPELVCKYDGMILKSFVKSFIDKEKISGSV